MGNQNNTLPNPALEITTRSGEIAYLPAYKLNQNNLERKGRIVHKQWLHSLLFVIVEK